DRAAFVAGRREGQLGLGQPKPVDADDRAELRPRDGTAAGYEGEQIGVAGAFDDEGLHDRGCRNAEKARSLVETSGLRALSDLDREAAGSSGVANPLEAVGHASGAASGSSATHSSSSVRSACHAA